MKLLAIRKRTPIINTGKIIKPIIKRIKHPVITIETLKKATISERLTTASVIATAKITINSIIIPPC